MGNLSSVRDKRGWNKAFFNFYLCTVHLTPAKSEGFGDGTKLSST